MQVLNQNNLQLSETLAETNRTLLEKRCELFQIKEAAEEESKSRAEKTAQDLEHTQQVQSGLLAQYQGVVDELGKNNQVLNQNIVQLSESLSETNRKLLNKRRKIFEMKECARAESRSRRAKTAHDLEQTQQVCSRLLAQYQCEIDELEKKNHVLRRNNLVLSESVTRTNKTLFNESYEFNNIKRDMESQLKFLKEKAIQLEKIIFLNPSRSAAPQSASAVASWDAPSVAPWATPSVAPWATPSAAPWATPSAAPWATPSAAPVAAPWATPSAAPWATPSAAPWATPSASPWATPSASPWATPSASSWATPSASSWATPSAAPAANIRAPTFGDQVKKQRTGLRVSGSESRY
uniref:Uncharacterized protein n=1 Tax=Cyclopterus lumpus TaxID=8103 RepID=A0A8C2X215_CYCLU